MKNLINVILLIAVILLSFYIGFRSNKVEVVKTKTEIVTRYDTITNVIDNTKPTQIKKVYITVNDTVRTHDTINKVVFKDKQVNEYTYIDSLENGRLESVILADTIYKRSIKLDTYDKKTETTTTNTIVKNSVMIGIDTNIHSGIQQSSLNLYFINKDKWLVKGGLGYDFSSQNAFYSVGFAIKF